MYNLGRDGEVTNLFLPTNYTTYFRGRSKTINSVDAI